MSSLGSPTASSTTPTHSSASSPSGSRPQDLGQDLWLHEPHFRPHLDPRCLCCPLVRSHLRPRPDGHPLCQQRLPNRFLQLPSRLRRALQPPGRLGDHWCALHHPALGRHHLWTYVGVLYRSTTHLTLTSATSALTTAIFCLFMPDELCAPGGGTHGGRSKLEQYNFEERRPIVGGSIRRRQAGPSHLVSIAKSRSRQCAGPWRAYPAARGAGDEKAGRGSVRMHRHPASTASLSVRMSGRRV